MLIPFLEFLDSKVTRKGKEVDKKDCVMAWIGMLLREELSSNVGVIKNVSRGKTIRESEKLVLSGLRGIAPRGSGLGKET